MGVKGGGDRGQRSDLRDSGAHKKCGNRLVLAEVNGLFGLPVANETIGPVT